MKYLPVFFLLILFSCNTQDELRVNNSKEVNEGDLFDIFEQSLFTNKWREYDIVAINFIGTSTKSNYKTATVMGKLKKNRSETPYNLLINDNIISNTSEHTKLEDKYTYNKVFYRNEIENWNVNNLKVSAKNSNDNLQLILPSIPKVKLIPIEQINSDEDLTISWEFSDQASKSRNNDELRGGIRIRYIGEVNNAKNSQLPTDLIDYAEEVDINALEVTIAQEHLEKFPKGGQVHISIASGRYSEDKDNEILLATGVMDNEYNIEVN